MANPPFDLRQNVSDPVNAYGRIWPHSLLCALAVLTRYLGKSLAVANALWLLMSNIFEYIGLYTNCWCVTVTAGLGDKAWAILFKTAAELSREASKDWGAGVSIILIVCLVSLAFFLLGCQGTGNEE